MWNPVGGRNDLFLSTPELEFAQELIKTEWRNCVVTKWLNLKEFMKWMDKLESENYLVGGFPNQKLNSQLLI